MNKNCIDAVDIAHFDEFIRSRTMIISIVEQHDD